MKGISGLGFSVHHGLEKFSVTFCEFGLELVLPPFWTKRQHQELGCWSLRNHFHILLASLAV